MHSQGCVAHVADPTKKQADLKMMLAGPNVTKKKKHQEVVNCERQKVRPNFVPPDFHGVTLWLR